MSTSHDDDAFNPAIHLISDRDLDRLASSLTAAEEAFHWLAVPTDPLAQEVARLRRSCDAFVAWRGSAVPAEWRRRQVPTGIAFRRGALQVVPRLVPQFSAGLWTLSVEITRRTGPSTLADLLLVTETFVDPGSVVSVGPVDPGHGPVRVGTWVVRIAAAARAA